MGWTPPPPRNVTHLYGAQPLAVYGAFRGHSAPQHSKLRLWRLGVTVWL